MLERESECLTANCLQILQFLNTETFVRSVFLVHLVIQQTLAVMSAVKLLPLR